MGAMTAALLLYYFFYITGRIQNLSAMSRTKAFVDKHCEEPEIYARKNRFQWESKECNKSRQTSHHNTIQGLPGL
jgi:hypothetical protein